MSTTQTTPFTATIDLASGEIAPAPEPTVRTLAHMRGLYQDEAGTADDQLIYRVLEIPAPANDNSNLPSSTTIIEPGRVGREFHMTKGHFHAVRERAEIYVGLSGEGRLLMATDDGEVAVEPMRAGTVNYVPGGWAHRSVNVGDEPLVFYAVYIGDAGYDYGTIEEQGFPVVLVADDEGGVAVEPNPRYRR
ncbi:glucose-6-phosphate isomerase family protein [Patulibacter sp. S7RM1-6]